MNKKSRRLTKLITSLNYGIDNLTKLIIDNKDNLFSNNLIDKQIRIIETELKIINFELSYLHLKNYGTK